MKYPLLAGSVVLAFALTGCKTTDFASLADTMSENLPINVNVEQTPEQAKHQALLEKATIDFTQVDSQLSESMDRYNKSATVAEGAVIGAIVGGGAAALAGGDGQMIGIAAAAGGVAGAWVGDKISDRTAKIIQDRALLDQYLAETKTANAHAEAALASIQAAIDKVNLEISTLGEKRQQGRVDKVELEANRLAIEDQIEKITATRSEAEQNLSIGLKLLTDVRTQASESELPEIVEAVTQVDLEREETERLAEVSVDLNTQVAQLSTNLQDNLI